ncbi:MAG: hypothetical protein ACFFHV_08700 [Promethearchaeota archaeon]
MDILSNEDEKEINELLNLNESIEEKLENAIGFFQKIFTKYEIEEFIECFSFFIIQEFNKLNSRLISIFFIEVFGLRAPEHYGSEENERNYVILPALTLAKLNEMGFDIDKIIGGFLQLDHEGDMSYQISQIIDYLLENALIIIENLTEILKNIFINDYASSVRIGRFLGTLIEYNIVKSNKVIDIIQKIRIDLNLNIKQISEILIGSNRKISSINVVNSLIEEILKLNNPDLKYLTDPSYISDQATGLTIIISNYLYENKSVAHIINLVLWKNATPVLAEAFKYLIDNSIINIKRLGFLLRDEFSNDRFDFRIMASLISTNFSYIEISKLLANIISKGSEIINNKNLIDIFSGFYDIRYHGFDDSDIKQILVNLQKFYPALLYRLEIEDFDKFLEELKSNKEDSHITD